MPFGLGFGELVFLGLPLMLVIVPARRILTKAGFSGVLPLVLRVPLVNPIALFAFAFTGWPVERRARGAVSRS